MAENKELLIAIAHFLKNSHSSLCPDSNKSLAVSFDCFCQAFQLTEDDLSAPPKTNLSALWNGQTSSSPINQPQTPPLSFASVLSDAKALHKNTKSRLALVTIKEALQTDSISTSQRIEGHLVMAQIYDDLKLLSESKKCVAEAIGIRKSATDLHCKYSEKKLVDEMRTIDERLRYGNSKNLGKENSVYKSVAPEMSEAIPKPQEDSKGVMEALLENPKLKNLAGQIMAKPELVGSLFSSFFAPKESEEKKKESEQCGAEEDNGGSEAMKRLADLAESLKSDDAPS